MGWDGGHTRAQWAKRSAAKPDDPSLIPETHTSEGKHWFLSITLCAGEVGTLAGPSAREKSCLRKQGNPQGGSLVPHVRMSTPQFIHMFTYTKVSANRVYGLDTPVESQPKTCKECEIIHFVLVDSQQVFNLLCFLTSLLPDPFVHH